MHLLMLSARAGYGKDVLPALEFLDHTLAWGPLDAEVVAATRDAEIVLVDATTDLGSASRVCRLAASADDERPVVAVVDDGSLAALKASWGFADWISPRAQPAEVETRLRLVAERFAAARPSRATSVGELTIDEETYIVRLRNRPLDLTFREFELLKFLVAHPGRVFTRSQLLQEVWGYDYFGGTRTVDVHIRRLRSKLGAEHETLIGTVRGVGYKLDPQGLRGDGGGNA